MPKPGQKLVVGAKQASTSKFKPKRPILASPVKTRSFADQVEQTPLEKIDQSKRKSNTQSGLTAKSAKRTKFTSERDNNFVEYDSEEDQLTEDESIVVDNDKQTEGVRNDDSSQESQPAIDAVNKESESVSLVERQQLQMQEFLKEQMSKQMANMMETAQKNIDSMMSDLKKTMDQVKITVQVAGEKANEALTPQRGSAVPQVNELVSQQGQFNSEVVGIEESPSGGTILSRVCKNAGTIQTSQPNASGVLSYDEVNNANFSSDESFIAYQQIVENSVADTQETEFAVVLENRDIDGQDEIRTANQRRREQVANEKGECSGRVDQAIRTAEAIKASVLRPPPGKNKDRSNLKATGDNNESIDQMKHDIYYNMNCDYQACLLISHVDQQTREKIKDSIFVELNRCLPKQRMFVREQNKVQMLDKDGETYLVAGKDRQYPAINGIKKWCDAFRVFIAIYVNKHPARAMELLQYMDTIQDAATRYIWENVDAYDVLFRQHMEKHPNRNWGTIYQMAWNFAMKEKLPNISPRRGQFKKKLTCRRLNKTGKCKFGNKCRYDHRCDSCGEFGHGAATCEQNKTKTKNNDKQEKGSGDK